MSISREIRILAQSDPTIPREIRTLAQSDPTGAHQTPPKMTLLRIIESILTPQIPLVIVVRILASHRGGLREASMNIMYYY